jgi:hypothetical protein
MQHSLWHRFCPSKIAERRSRVRRRGIQFHATPTLRFAWKERAPHKLALTLNPALAAVAAAIEQLQQAEFTDLVSRARPLLDRLSRV